jgi:hypothetical protein
MKSTVKVFQGACISVCGRRSLRRGGFRAGRCRIGALHGSVWPRHRALPNRPLFTRVQPDGELLQFSLFGRSICRHGLPWPYQNSYPWH